MGLTITKTERQPNPHAPYKNKWEADYAAYLEAEKRQQRIEDWRYEAFQVKAVEATANQPAVWYTPDFVVFVWSKDRLIAMEFHEVKGFFRPKDKLRMKAAREKLPTAIKLILATKVNGGWNRQEF